MSANDCESRCLQNCSCTAYALVNASQGNSVNCLSWYGDLMDIVHDTEGQILYVRVHDRELILLKRQALIGANVFESSRALLKISDFGLARMFGSDQTEADTKRVVVATCHLNMHNMEYSQKNQISSAFGVFAIRDLESPADRPTMPLVRQDVEQ
ncbi:hypothetical protein NC653_041839 [Populus alba x Populus x berolinensis]|uniref:Apple domain-containing protein n=1 Tax=Populus alba x Populus x berolinensis TaxID=444605 RepID=A0AAD6L9I1_9ROSI|nr:hypothetical protein NC653_041839 [Populus alba x Populus x berolinensis]